jgi:4-hydroxybenzoate polyprenyltransferase
MRVPHWIKNVIVLFPVIFGMKMAEPTAWGQAALAALAFCLAASGTYVLNDIRDRAHDRHHPRKAARPIARGELGLRAAWGLGLALTGLALAVGYAVNAAVLAFVAAYVVVTAAYSFGLKHAMLLDVMLIAAGFVLRAAAGAVAIRVVISPWLVVCTFTVCLFLGFCKRYNELVTLAGGKEDARRHRPTLDGYSPELLTHLITLSAAIAILSFLLYATSPMTLERFHTLGLLYTLPLVIYGVCRVAMLSMRGAYADPVEIMLRDRPFQATVILWTALAAVAVKWGEAIEAWLAGAL